MVSRRRILSRSRDDLNLDLNEENEDGSDNYFRNNNIDEEDIWYHKDKLYKDHIQEVLNKWESIDDEIWAKVIVLERNRRVAKAYARAPVLTVNGSEDGFDGLRIGMNGFANPMRDAKCADLKQLIGMGCKVKMDGTGNILVKRLSRAPVYVKNTIEDNAISNDILKLPNNGLLEPVDKPFKLFDMKKFQQNVNREMKRAYPDRRKLEAQCISSISFVKNDPDLLCSPIWIMLINIVALEMLRAKMPLAGRPGPTQDAKKRFAASGSSDEDPYSLTPSGSSGSSGKGKDGQGNAKDKDYFVPQNWTKPRPDYSDDFSSRTLEKRKTQKVTDVDVARARNGLSRKTFNDDKHKQDDPYYCGMKARVPNFVSMAAAAQNKKASKENQHQMVGGVKGRLRNAVQQQHQQQMSPSTSAPNLAQLPGQAPPFWWQSRLYPDSAPNPQQNGQLGGYHHMTPMGFRTSAADLTAYRYAGGRPRGYQTSTLMNNHHHPLPQAVAGPPHRPTVFQTGWE